MISVSGCGGDSYYLPTDSRTVETGLERFLRKDADTFEGKRIALVTNHSGVDFNLRHNISLLREKGITISFILVPEHGLYGYHDEYDTRLYRVDRVYDLILYNLHKLNQRRLKNLLSGTDGVLFDIQDMGMRCYTYISDLKMVMDAMKGTRIPLVVLDRPNPVGFLGVDGPYLDARYRSRHVGSFPAPLNYGLTLAEAAHYYSGEYNLDINLTTVKMKGYRRDMRFGETGFPWVPPSPNLPTYHSAILYTFLVYFEGVNVSLGRGTSKPFEYIGAPWIEPSRFTEMLQSLKLPGLRFRPVYFMPSESEYNGQVCGGAHIYFTGEAFSPVETAYRIIQALMEQYPRASWVRYRRWYTIDKIAGTNSLRKAIDEGMRAEEYLSTIQPDISAFEKKRKKYFLYR